VDSIIQVSHIAKSFHLGVQELPVLKDISFEVERGDFALILGPSGCGKSTLLHTILGLEPPTSGEVFILGSNLYKEYPSEDDRSIFRKKHIGMVYQQPNWIKSLNVMENVAFPLSLVGMSKVDSSKKAWELLSVVGMQNWLNHKPTELSGGQQQRIALARALINDAEIIIADEPTGNLDYESGQHLMTMLSDLSLKGKTIIMVTHDLEYTKFARSAVKLLDGKVVDIVRGEAKAKLDSEVKGKRGTDTAPTTTEQPAAVSPEVATFVKSSEQAVEAKIKAVRNTTETVQDTGKDLVSPAIESISSKPESTPVGLESTVRNPGNEVAE
jgi:putative ABC transport system ATP-binding protein